MLTVWECLHLCFIIPDTEPLREWEYLPPILPRPYKGFCGLKNAGATCYMNSVLQQLFMVPTIRYGILSASGATNDPNEDFSGECDVSFFLLFYVTETTTEFFFHSYSQRPIY